MECKVLGHISMFFPFIRSDTRSAVFKVQKIMPNVFKQNVKCNFAHPKNGTSGAWMERVIIGNNFLQS